MHFPFLVIVSALLCVIVVLTIAHPTRNNTNISNYSDKKKQVISYLLKYGYLDDNFNALSSDNKTIAAAVKRAVALFQEYYQIPGNGVLNEITIAYMRKARCGLEDILRSAFNSVVKKWPKNHLTWNFYLADAALIKVAEEAFAIWSANSSLTFERNIMRPDILISYRSGVHTFANTRLHNMVCPLNLDGVGNVLAHAYFPTGDINDVSEVHIDQDEPWYIFLGKNPPQTYGLLQTLTHEIGHSLGLRHGMREESVMFPIAPDITFPVKLSMEDVLAIQNLYGVKKEEEKEEEEEEEATTNILPIATTTIMITTPKIDNTNNNNNNTIDLCDLTHVDAILILEHKIFIAYKRYVWSININGRKKSYNKPLILRDYFPQSLMRVQAAYQRPSGDIVLFANDMIYMVRYPSFKLVDGWPRLFKDIRLPPNSRINAAINTNKGRTFIIFNDDNVAEIDECLMQISKFYSIKRIFPGIPSTVSFAFRHTDGHLYFIGKQKFYKFNEFYNTITTAGDFDLSILGIECPRDGLLRQLQDLLNRLVRSFANNSLEEKEEEEEEEEEEE